MHIVVEPVDVGSIEAIVMVAADEYFVFIWQVTKPVEKINCFLFCPYHTEVAGMYHHIGLGQIPKPPVAVMRIGEMEYFHVIIVSVRDMGRRKSSELWYLKMYL